MIYWGENCTLLVAYHCMFSMLSVYYTTKTGSAYEDD